MRCPVCKADNNSTPQCRRCKVDLSLLVALEQRRAHELGLAVARLQSGDAAGALAAATEANRLQSDETSRRLLAVARLLQGDYGGALALQRECSGATY